jgi:chitin deacetylase
MPQAWKDALSAAVQAGKIPNIPPSSDPNNGNPVYPPGYNPYSPQVCSGTYKCRIAGDVWDAPEGVIGISFDDGPLPVSVFHLRRRHVTRPAFARLCRGPTTA